MNIAFISQGVFRIQVGRKEHLGEPFRAIWSRADVEYRVSHPNDAGHTYAIVEPSPELWEEVLFQKVEIEDDAEIRYGISGHLSFLRAQHALRAAAPDSFAREEIALDLLAVLTRTMAGSPRATPARRATVRRVREAILARLDENLSLAMLARVGGCSPFHLARIFRRECGISMRRFRLEARISHALSLIADGQDDLTSVALDCGFASHSHMTEAFRSILGQSPSSTRVQLRIRSERLSSRPWHAAKIS